MFNIFIYKKSLLFCLTIFLIPFSIFAQKKNSLKIFINYFKNGDCNSLIQKLDTLTEKKSWDSRDLWLRSRILNIKCEIKLGNNKKALKIIDTINEKEFIDALIFQKIRALLKEKKYKDALANIRVLLKHPKQKFYLPSLREEIKKEFKSDKELIEIFPFLIETKNTPKLFLNDYEIHSILIRGAKLSGIKLNPKLRLIGWEFPIDEKTARTSQNNINKYDLKFLSKEKILNRVNTLSKLRLNKYLIEHIPQLTFLKNQKLLQNLGKIYLKSLFKEKFYSQIINLYKRKTLTKKWLTPLDDQLYWTARSFLKRKKIKEGKSIIYKLLKQNPNSKYLPILFNTIATRYKLDFKNEKALFWWKKLVTDFPKNRLYIKSIWSLSWTFFKEKNFEKALFYLNKGLETKIYNSEMKAKLLYWRAEIFQKIGKFKLARKSYKSLILNQPNTYYGMRLISSEKNIKDLFDTKIYHQIDTFKTPNGKIDTKTKLILRRSNFLFDILESNQALNELFSEISRNKNKILNWSACLLLKKRGEYNSILKIMANSYMSTMITLRIKNSQIWQIAYPKAHWGLVKTFSQKAGIDPYFSLAIMREESHFDPMALSSSNAMGLMQLMPATARDLASRKKIKLKNKKEIFHPKLNIKLGIFYLGKLAKKFQSELIYTAGGYNAGPHNMSKWINRSNAISIDNFVEDIPFNETKNYVKRVYRSYKIYKNIYD